MPIRETLPAVSAGDPQVTPAPPAPDTLAEAQRQDADHDRVRWAVADLDQEADRAQGEHPTSMTDAPARSVRRATARRASSRRAVARTRHGDPETLVLDFLTQHPGRTVGDLAKGLNLEADLIAGHLSRLAATGEIERTSHGFSTTDGIRTPHT
jgi:hypothetical protein